MSDNGNGVIRVGRKGLKKFAFGDDGTPFEVDVVVTFQAWICIDEEFRDINSDGIIPTADMPRYHQTALQFVNQFASDVRRVGTPFPSDITVAEALEFLARLRECYDELVSFFHPKSRVERGSPDSSAVELRFSEESATPPN